MVELGLQDTVKKMESKEKMVKKFLENEVWIHLLYMWIKIEEN
jgi:hypothetical protein